jgi:hypothetical protein
MNKKLALLMVAPLSLVGLAGLAVPASAATKPAVAKVGAKCKKSGTTAKTAKGSALVCKKSGSSLKWALAPKKSADTTVPTKATDTKPKTADTTVPKVAETTVPKS